jgi:hypothetical protein
MMRRVRTHVFQENPDLGTDHKGQRFCACCPLPEGHDIHDLPEQPAHVAAAEARRLGERGDE